MPLPTPFDPTKCNPATGYHIPVMSANGRGIVNPSAHYGDGYDGTVICQFCGIVGKVKNGVVTLDTK